MYASNCFKNLSAYFLLFAAFVFTNTSAQTALYTENFNTGNGSFTVTTTDVGCTSSGDNVFIVNNSYTGGSGTVTCLGFPLPFTIGNTPQQPGGITGGPTSGYLHTISNAAIASSVTNCSFLAADGLCSNAGNIFARMTNDISTVGNATVDLKFWWMCNGGPTYFGEVYYSTNGGSSWTQLTTPLANYSGTSSWQEQTISNPAFGNQATLRIGFRFVNQIGTSAADPGFAIDDVRLLSSTSVQNSISTTFSPASNYCTGSEISVPYAALGTYTAGNVFTVQLSDASGSFASPVSIGTLSSTSGSGTITAIIPAGTAAGSGYKIRVVSSAPSTIGTENTVAFAISAGSSVIPVTTNPPNITSLCGGPITLTIPGGYTSVVWSSGQTGVNSITVSSPGTYSVTGTSGGCSASSEPITIVQNQNPLAGFTYDQPTAGVYVINFTNTSTNASSYLWDFGNGFTTTAANPAFTFSSDGNFPVRLIATNACGSDTIDIIVVASKVGINDIAWNIEMNLMPNPFSNTVRIETQLAKPEKLELSIFDGLGKLIRKESYTSAGKTSRLIDLSTESNGIYFLVLKGETGSLSRKLVKN
jgi:hypothetical protein